MIVAFFVAVAWLVGRSRRLPAFVGLLAGAATWASVVIATHPEIDNGRGWWAQSPPVAHAVVVAAAATMCGCGVRLVADRVRRWSVTVEL